MTRIEFALQDYKSEIDSHLIKVKEIKILQRIWNKDFTVWSDKPDEISNRLGWLDCIETTSIHFDDIKNFVEELRKENFTNVLLLGMGGSSLAPEVLSLSFGTKEKYLNLQILDSTHPDLILEVDKLIDYNSTLFLVSTKSGGTVETFSLMKYFYNRVVSIKGKENAGKYFSAITDPGSGLESIAKELNFRKIFLNDPNIGGRYSALSLFGVVPAALIGIDLNKFFDRVKRVVEENKSSAAANKIDDSTCLGVVMGALANVGRDKLTLILSKDFESFGSWIEQLVAESIGKDGKGVLPVDGEKLLEPNYYSNDRVFVSISLSNDSSFQKEIDLLKNSSHPVISIQLDDVYDLAGEFFRWEMATAVCGHIVGVQPFDQPNVESAKIQARQMLKEYNESGALPSEIPVFSNREFDIYSDFKDDSPEKIVEKFLSNYEKGKSYISIQAYLQKNEEINSLLEELRYRIQTKLFSAVTIGYGPRFLHSTGQLHKGDEGKGLFIQITDTPLNDAAIPDNPGEENSSITFGILIQAQAMGDRQALLNNKRKVIRFHLKQSAAGSLKSLINLF